VPRRPRALVAEETLPRATRDVTADAAHQLRTPLTALTIRLEEIVAAARLPSVREEAAAALAAAERLAWVVDSMLAEHGRAGRNAGRELLDVDGVLERQEMEWRPAFHRARRRVTVVPSGLKAAANAGALAQVVATLIDNALAHGGGTVTLRAREAAGHTVIDVADEGRGVTDEITEWIFERSFSGSSSSGLGLALARELVEADGGRLELTRARPPIFTIFLAPPADS